MINLDELYKIKKNGGNVIGTPIMHNIVDFGINACNVCYVSIAIDSKTYSKLSKLYSNESDIKDEDKVVGSLILTSYEDYMKFGL